MAISFNQVPSAIRVPFLYAEFSNQGATPGATLLAYQGLMFGQKTGGGSATANTLVGVNSTQDAATKFGNGSMLHRMSMAWFASNPLTPLFAMPLADAGGAVAATGTLTITGTASAAGSLALYIAGDLVTVGVAAGDTPTVIAGNIVSAVTAQTQLPVTAGNTSGVVTFTAKNAGLAGNDIDVRVNYYTSDVLPAGVTAAVVAMASGATNPTLTTAIANLGNQWFQVLAFPYNDAASLTALETELTSRAGPLRMVDGVAIAATCATLANAETLGNSRNNPYVSIVSSYKEPRWTAEVAAGVAGIVAYYGNIDPARPFQTLQVPWLMGPVANDQFTLQQNNALLFDGISTNYVDAGGSVRVQRLISTYKVNAQGAPDVSYLDINTALTLQYLRYDFRTFWLNKYPRHKLADDGTRYGAGQAVMTPGLGRAEAIARFRLWEDQGLVQDADAFKAALIVERSLTDVNRLDFMLPPTLINQLRVTGVQIAFLL